MPRSPERIAVALTTTTTLFMIVAFGIDVLLPSRFSAPPLALGFGVFLVTSLSMALCARVGRAAGVAGVSLATGLLVSAGMMAFSRGGVPIALAVVGPVAGAGAWLLARRLPATMDGMVRRRPAAAVLWLVAGVLCMVQTARLGAFMADSEFKWWHTTTHPFWAKHMCMVAYTYGAELDNLGECNVYDPSHYPAMNPEAENRTQVAHMEPDDPYQYPPQFLLLPHIALALSHDFVTIRTLWFALQTIAFVLLAVFVSRWVGGRAGAMATALIPVVFLSVPAILNFQYGQFHLATIALSVGALMAFESRRGALGGLLLASAILSKIFPAFLLPLLIVRRQWRALAWTAVFGVSLTVLAWIVLGADPFVAFFTQHVPRLRSGAAFAFADVWPDFKIELLAGNVSPFALVQKLGELGVPGMSLAAAKAFHGAFSLALVALSMIAARGFGSRRQRLVIWLAVLNLGAMASPAAWGDYVPVGSLWLLSFLAAGMWASKRRAWLLSVVWAFCFLLPGVVPIVKFPPAAVTLVASIVGTLLLIAFNSWVILSPARGHSAEVA